MRYAVLFAVFCAVLGFAAPVIVERIILRMPYESETQKEISNDLTVLRIGSRLREFTHDVRLDCAAQAHADDIYYRRSCTNIGSQGETPRIRLESCGLGELTEVAQLVICNRPWDLAKVLEALPEHQQILKMPEWRYIGIGIREDYYVIYLTY